jgi:hypothetical protein
MVSLYHENLAIDEKKNGRWSHRLRRFSPNFQEKENKKILQFSYNTVILYRKRRRTVNVEHDKKISFRFCFLVKVENLLKNPKIFSKIL